MTIQINVHGMGHDESPDPATPRASWVVRVTDIETRERINYIAWTWAEVEVRVRQVLADHDIPADPETRIEAVTLEQARDIQRRET